MLNSIFIEIYNTQVEYKNPEFSCECRDDLGLVTFQIKGTFKDEQ